MPEPTLTAIMAEIRALRTEVAALAKGTGTVTTTLVDAATLATLATELGVARSYVYAHREELGGIRLGGPRGRLRFDVEQARRTLGTVPPPTPPRSASPKRVARRRSSAGSILAVRGRGR